jgi:hypothetical protein
MTLAGLLLVACTTQPEADVSGRFEVVAGCGTLDGVPVYSEVISRYDAGAAALRWPFHGVRIRPGAHISALGERTALQRAQDLTGRIFGGDCFDDAVEVVVIEKFLTGCDPSCSGL